MFWNSFTISPSGAASYTIQGGSTVVSPLANTNYTVRGSNGACLSNIVTSSITVNANPTVAVNSGSICSGNSFTINPSGASAYTISGGNFVVSPTSNSSYNVVGTSAQGCVGSNTAVSSFTVNTLPVITVPSNASLLCVGSTASLTVSGANTYTWNTSSNAAVIAVSPTVTTTYTVSGTNTSGCSNLTTVVQNVSTCTDIKNLALEAANKVLVYPNPSNGTFTIKNTSGSKIDVIIVNALGQIVLSKSISTENETINLKEQANGIYYLKAGDKIVKLIKQ